MTVKTIDARYVAVDVHGVRLPPITRVDLSRLGRAPVPAASPELLAFLETWPKGTLSVIIGCTANTVSRWRRGLSAPSSSQMLGLVLIAHLTKRPSPCRAHTSRLKDMGIIQ